MARSTPPVIVNGHALTFVEDGEEWDADNELYCKLIKAVCQKCGAAGQTARSQKGAVRKFERQHMFKPCQSSATNNKKARRG